MSDKTRKKGKKEEQKRDFFLRKEVNIVLLIVYAIILTGVFFKVYPKVFDEKLNLGGDNAGYYILGSALASGQGFTNIHMLGKPPHNHYPPGYPVIIAGAMKVFSTKIIFIKKLNGFFFFLSLILMFVIVKKLTDNIHIAFITVLFLIYNYFLLTYSFIMMSEIPFLFFSLLAIWLFMITDLSKPWYRNVLFYLVILTVTFTYYIRSSGLSLYAGIALYLVFRKKWKYAALLTVVFILLILPWYLRTKHLGGNPYFHAMMMINPYRPELGQMHFGDWFSRFFQNLQRYISREVPAGTFDFIWVKNYKDPIQIKEWIGGIISIAIMIFGLVRLKKYRDLIFFYLLAAFGILLIWPVVWTGPRFMLPLLPLLTFLLINGIAELFILAGEKLFHLRNPLLVPVLLVVLSLFSVKSYSRKAIRILEVKAQQPYSKKYKNYFEVARWAYKNTPDTSVVACRKGQLFYLYSHRYITGFASTLDREKEIEYLKKASTDYVVLDQLGFSSTARYLYPAIKKYPKKFKIIYHLKDPDTYFMQFKPEIGYWGEWKDGKRAGHGVYVWPNGQKYIGEWKDNMREGKGKLITPNKTILEGTWEKDKLEGIVTVRSPAGEVKSIMLFKNDKPVKTLQKQP